MLNLNLKYKKNGEVVSHFQHDYIDQIDRALQSGDITIREAHDIYYHDLKPHYNEDTLDAHWEQYMNLLLSQNDVSFYC